jgi:hypothetical protein
MQTAEIQTAPLLKIGLVGFFVALSAVPEGHANAQRHESNGRDQQHDHGAIHRVLAILAGGCSG